jgi:hypothetical protein
MVEQHRLLFGIFISVLLTSSAAEAQTYPDLQRFRGAWVRFIDEDTVVRSLTDFPEAQVRLRRCKI